MTTFYIAWTLHILEGVMRTSVSTVKVLFCRDSLRAPHSSVKRQMSFSLVCRASPGLSVWYLTENRLLPPSGDSTLLLNREGFVPHLGGSLQLTFRYPNALKHRSPCPEAGGRDRQVSRERADLSKEWLPVKFNDWTGFGGKKTSQTIRPSQRSESHYKSCLISKTEEE